MNEHGYIRSIHRKLPKTLYVWKINDNYQGGVADAYYSGPKGDIWVEYKYINLPKRPTTMLPEQFGLSDQQLGWLRDRAGEGRNVSLVVGSDYGDLILTDTDAFDIRMSQADFKSSAVDKNSTVAHILNYTI